LFSLFRHCVFSNIFLKSAEEKRTLRIINPNNEDPLWAEKAMYHANIDSLRFVSERRRLPIEGTALVLELFSAEELLTEYKKPIHPLNIKDPAKARKYKLRLDNGMFTPIPVK
jgi:hypothetical protein